MLTGFSINTAKPVRLSCAHSPWFDLEILHNIKPHFKYHNVYFMRFEWTDTKATNWYSPSTNLHKT